MTLQGGLYLLFLLLFFLATGFVASVLFLFQRRPWQRAGACLFGIALFLYALANEKENAPESTKAFELIGFLWSSVMLLLPEKDNLRHDAIKATAVIFLIQCFFTGISFVYRPLLFNESFNFVQADVYALPVLGLGALLFYSKKDAGLLLLILYFIFKCLVTGINICSVIILQLWFPDLIISLSAFSCIYFAYYTGCLYFLFRKSTRLQFSADKAATAFVVIAGVIVTAVIFLF